MIGDPVSLPNTQEKIARIRARETDNAGGGDDGTTDSDMSDRLTSVETDVAGIKGSLDWAKIAASTLVSVTIGGFAIVITLMIFLFNRVDAVGSRVDSIIGKINTEFQAQRAEQSAQISTLANVITATKQQAPQVLLVPAPAPEAAPAPAKPKLQLPPLKERDGGTAYEKVPPQIPGTPGRT